MSTSDFVAQLREIAINARAPALVIDQIDAIVEGPGEDEIEDRCEAARDEGISDGRDTQWEICFDMLEAKLNAGYLGLTETQIEQIRELMLGVRPE